MNAPSVVAGWTLQTLDYPLTKSARRPDKHACRRPVTALRLRLDTESRGLGNVC